MKLDLLEKVIGNIGKYNWKHWKFELEPLENKLETLKNGFGNVGKWNCNIGKFGKWNWKH